MENRMQNRMIKYVLVANGNKALIYKCNGNLNNLELEHKFITDESTKSSHELGSDKPGRGESGMNGSIKHSTDSKGDLHKKEKHNFIVEVVKFINDEANTNKFDKLIICSSPEALGEIRSQLGKHASSLISDEINKDLTHLPIGDIIELIQKHRSN
ncbi:MAG: host attachment protein [Rickettsiales bacterium]|nr:MAG: host attachment protein [Rickettsiales bacterium]